MKKRILIVGAGLSGLSAAVHLSLKGYAVTILEKRPYAGGRAFSFQKDFWPYPIDNGPHVMLGCYQDLLGLLEIVGNHGRLYQQNRLRIPYYLTQDKIIALQEWPLWTPFHLLMGMMKFPLFNKAQKWSLVRVLWRLSGMRENAQLDQITAAQWLKAHQQDKTIIDIFWRPLILATLNSQPEQVSFLQLFRVLKIGFLQEKKAGRMILMPEGLTLSLIDPIVRWLKNQGVAIDDRETVQRLVMKNDSIQRVITNGSEYNQFDYLISALPFHELHDVLRRSGLNSQYNFDVLGNFQNNPIINFHFWYKSSLIDESFVAFLSRTAQWLFTGQIHHGWVHHAIVLSDATNLLTVSKEKIVSILISDLKQIFPEFKPEHIKQHYLTIQKNATLRCEPGMERKRPKAGPFWGNFYVIGDWTQTGLPPTMESAARSGKIVSERL